MRINYSKKVNQLPPYLFAEIDRKRKTLIEQGVDVISLGVGDPDLPTPNHIVDAMKKAVEKPEYHQYPFGSGLKKFRQVVANWCKNRFRISLDPDTEIHAIIGSKEGIGHLPLAFVDAGDIVLVPEPGYPVYQSGTIFAGGKVQFMPLKEENNFSPDLGKIPKKILQKTKLMFLNYPNNPTAAIATKDFFVKVVRFAKKNNISVVHDAAYSEMYYSTTPPISFLSVPGAKEVGIEFHSLSKTYNMTGWRVGWVCGNAEIIRGLSKVKDNYDSGVFSAIQETAIAALTGPQDCVAKMRKIYDNRFDILVDGLNSAGWQVKKPLATFYLWAKVPKGYTSTKCVNRLLDEGGIVCTPGSGLGPSGEGYVRFSVTVSDSRLKEAVARISKIRW